MRKFLIASFLVLVFAVPALAKPIDVYPVSCNDLWAAVKDTLGNQSNYGIVSTDDYRQRASFVVVGERPQYTEKVELTAKDGSCWAKAIVVQDGVGDGDWRQFHHRLAQSLTRLQAAKPKQPATTAGQPQDGSTP
jgi:hypothetical protein